MQKFFCLHRRDADTVPKSVEKTFLEEAGLGEKSLVISMSSSPDELRNTIVTQFPKLKTGGGFEFLHCQPKSRDLHLIPSRVCSSIGMLRRMIGNDRVYIRPIQRNIDLAVVKEDINGVSLLFN